MIIDHISSGRVFLILVSRLSCDNFEHCKAAGNGRFGGKYLPEFIIWPHVKVPPRLLHVVKSLAFEIHLVVSITSLKYLPTRGIV